MQCYIDTSFSFVTKQVDAIIRNALHEVGSNVSASDDNVDDLSYHLMNNIQQVK